MCARFKTHSPAGLKNVHRDEADHERHGSQNFEVDESLKRNAAHARHIGHARHAMHHRTEDDGRDQHPDRLDEPIAQRLHLCAQAGTKHAEKDADHHREKNLQTQSRQVPDQREIITITNSVVGIAIIIKRRFPPQFWAVMTAATFLGFLGIATVLPELGPHVRNDLGGSDETVGFVVGIFSFVASPPGLSPGRWRYVQRAQACIRRLAFWLRARQGRISRAFGYQGRISGAHSSWIPAKRAFTPERPRGRSNSQASIAAARHWATSTAASGVGCPQGPVLGHWVSSFQHAALTQLILTKPASSSWPG